MEIKISEKSLILCGKNLYTAFVYDILLNWYSIQEKYISQENNKMKYTRKTKTSSAKSPIFISKDDIFKLSLGSIDTHQINNALRFLLRKKMIKLIDKPQNGIFSYSLIFSEQEQEKVHTNLEKKENDYDIQKAYRELDKDLRNTIYEEFIIEKENNHFLKFEDFIKKYL